MDDASQALVELGLALRHAQYNFVTVTPETHRRVLARPHRLTADRASRLRDVFGWNYTFQPDTLPRALIDLLVRADQAEWEGALMRSRVRFATLQGRMFVHSGYPTTQSDAVFFGPDTYRFCALLQRWAPTNVVHLVDVGAGSGAGGIVLAGRAERLVLTDVNARALRFSRINAALASVSADVIASDVLSDVEGTPDLIVANPPYMRDASGRAYREGGGAHGEGLSLRIVNEGLARLAPGGTLIVYTGAPIVGGVDIFKRQLLPILKDHRVSTLGSGFTYEELDPDVFGEELERPEYAAVDRIAAVGLRITTDYSQSVTAVASSASRNSSSA